MKPPPPAPTSPAPASPAPAQNRDRKGAAPHTYLLTFSCYGSWLPGQPGAVDRIHNQFGALLPQPSPRRTEKAAGLMRDPSYQLDAERRKIVLEAIQEVVTHRRWMLVAAHVRTNHVHIVVDAHQSPEQLMTTFKSYASRALDAESLDTSGRKRWARHSSTRHLWTKESVDAAVHYIVCEQREPMAVFVEGAEGRSLTVAVL